MFIIFVWIVVRLFVDEILYMWFLFVVICCSFLKLIECFIFIINIFIFILWSWWVVFMVWLGLRDWLFVRIMVILVDLEWGLYVIVWWLWWLWWMLWFFIWKIWCVSLFNFVCVLDLLFIYWIFVIVFKSEFLLGYWLKRILVCDVVVNWDMVIIVLLGLMVNLLFIIEMKLCLLLNCVLDLFLDELMRNVMFVG